MDVSDRRFFGRAWASLASTRNVFGKLCLIALLQFVPVLGQMVTLGYFLGWVREAAWGMETPMPAHVLSGGDRAFWPRAAKAWVVSLLYGLIGGAFYALLCAVWALFGHMQPGIIDDIVLGVLVALGLFGGIWLLIFYYVGLVRLAIYNRFSAAWQWGKCLRMAGRDFGGLVKLFFGAIGLNLLISLFVGIVASLMGLAFFTSAVASPILAGLAGAFAYGYEGLVSAFVSLAGVLIVATPLLAVLSFFLNVPYLVISAVCWRALGNWATQFDVPRWGAMADPLPEPRADAACAAASCAPVAPIASPAPAGQAAVSAATTGAPVTGSSDEPSQGGFAQATTPVAPAPASAADASVAPDATPDASQGEQGTAAGSPQQQKSGDASGLHGTDPTVPVADLDAPASAGSDGASQSGASQSSVLASLPPVAGSNGAATSAQQGSAPVSNPGTPTPAVDACPPQGYVRPEKHSHPVGVIVLCLLGSLVLSVLIGMMSACASTGAALTLGSRASSVVSTSHSTNPEGYWTGSDGQALSLNLGESGIWGEGTFTWFYDAAQTSYAQGTYRLNDISDVPPSEYADELIALVDPAAEDLADALFDLGLTPSALGVGVYELQMTADSGMLNGQDATSSVRGNVVNALFVVYGNTGVLLDMSALQGSHVSGDAVLFVTR